MSQMRMLHETKDYFEASRMSYRKVVSMRKEQAVELMTKAINDMNTEKAEEHGVPANEIQQMVWQATPELNRVNGLLFDVLFENGFIN
jgi:hypothetical protein